MNSEKRVTAKVPTELHFEVKRFAKKHGCTIQDLIVLGLREVLSGRYEVEKRIELRDVSGLAA